MRLLFIRHGDPDYEHDCLTEKGRREAEALAEHSESLRMGEIFVSPLGRAQETASYSLKKLGKTGTTREFLQEFITDLNINRCPELIRAYPDTRRLTPEFAERKRHTLSTLLTPERAAEEEAMRAQMDAEAYEAQLAAEQAAYDAAHGDESDLYTTMEVRDPDELRSTLVENNAYAIGDSMIEGMNDGQYVNTENLIFRRGCGTYDSLELFERAVNLQASVVWVQLGLNDMDMYISDVGQFKDNYRKLVLYLQENLPDCRIFLCNINPISPDACRRHPQYEYAGQYNQAIMELCEELGVTYVDNTTLVLGHPELWDTDGIHPVQDVYLWMLSHMCYEAGI